MKEPPEQPVDREAIKEFLGDISDQTLLNYTAAGMPYLQARRKRLFLLSEVTAWLKRHEATEPPSNDKPRSAGRPKGRRFDLREICEKVMVRT